MVKICKGTPRGLKRWYALLLIGSFVMPLPGVFAQPAILLTIDTCYAGPREIIP